MDTAATNPAAAAAPALPQGVQGSPLTLLELNKIRLDMKHTVLTPNYLESLPGQTQ